MIGNKIADVITTIGVPTFLAAGLVLSLAAAGRVPSSVRVPAYAGFWVGILACTAYALLLPHLVPYLPLQMVAPNPPSPASLHRLMSSGAVGILVGVAGLGLFGLLRRSRWVGVVCFCQSLGSSGLLLSYYVVDGWKEIIVGLAMGCALGTFLLFLIPRRINEWAVERYEDRTIRRRRERVKRKNDQRVDRARRREPRDRPPTGRSRGWGRLLRGHR
ncbi:hypothetical protein ACFPK1_12720 [Actinomycetospora rhizophila]|uniref:Uncharacterized protein n=1 Tax=Actinomycetospora rhizophila TaxID=1416876 RepID=A0ABV9ZBW9_9PSEU